MREICSSILSLINEDYCGEHFTRISLHRLKIEATMSHYKFHYFSLQLLFYYQVL